MSDKFSLMKKAFVESRKTILFMLVKQTAVATSDRLACDDSLRMVDLTNREEA